ncbi:MAG: aminotransferase class V-fold PLP-dependent enzyme [Pseudomonadota bacterium]
MLTSQRALFDMPRDVCFMNAAAWSPIPKSAVEAGKIGAERKSRPWEMEPDLAEHQIERARSAAAGMINADPDDLALISSVGYGVSTAAKVLSLPANHRIIVLDSDHSSPTLEWMTRAEESGCDIDVVKVGPDHDWTSAILETIARPGAKPIALTSISSVHWSDGGMINLERVQAALKPLGSRLLIDATHAAGVTAMDVKQLDPDFVVFPTYKWLLGPYARAFLYVAKRHQNGIPLEQTSYGRKRVTSEDRTYFTDLNYVENARRFDMGERDFFVSLDVAAHSMELIHSWGIDNVRARLKMLTSQIAERLADVNGISILREDLRAPHIISLGFPQGMPDGFANRLAKENVFAASRLGRLRVSPHVYNDEQDCARFADVIRSSLS